MEEKTKNELKKVRAAANAPAPAWMQKTVGKLPDPNKVFLPKLANAPEFTFSKKINDSTFKGKVGKFGASIAEGTLNIPSKIVQNYGKTALDINSGKIFTGQGARQFAGRTAENALDIVSLGKAKTATQAGKTFLKGAKPLRTIMKESGKQGVKLGGLYGGGYGLANEMKQEETTLGETLKSGAIGAGGGAVFGGVLGGGLPALGALPGSIRNSVKNKKGFRTDTIPAHYSKSGRVPVFEQDGKPVIFPKLGKDQRFVGRVQKEGRDPVTRAPRFSIRTERFNPEQRIERKATPTLQDWFRETRAALPRPGMSIEDVSARDLKRGKSKAYKVMTGQSESKKVAEVPRDISTMTKLPRDINATKSFFQKTKESHPKENPLRFVDTLHNPDEIYHYPKNKKLNFFDNSGDGYLVGTQNKGEGLGTHQTITQFTPRNKENYFQNKKKTGIPVFPKRSGGAANPHLSQVNGSASEPRPLNGLSGVGTFDTSVSNPVPKVKPTDILALLKKKDDLGKQRGQKMRAFQESEQGRNMLVENQVARETYVAPDDGVIPALKNTPFFKKEGVMKDTFGEGYIMEKNGRRVIVEPDDIPKYKGMGYAGRDSIESKATEAGFGSGEEYLDAMLSRQKNKPVSYETEATRFLKENDPEYSSINDEIEKVSAEIEATGAKEKGFAFGLRVGKEAAKEKVQAFKDSVLKRKDRVSQVRAAKDFFALSDMQFRKIGGARDVRYMTEGEFQGFMNHIYTQSEREMKRTQALTQVMAQIKDKELSKVDNLRKAMKLPPISRMRADQLETLDRALEPYQKGDTFLSQRKLETVKNTELTGIKTLREAKERLAARMGVPAEKLDNVSASWGDSFRYDTALAEKSPFYSVMVDDTNRAMLSAETKFLEHEENINRLMAEARGSRKRSAIDRLIPQDRNIFKYLESSDKSEIARDMTPAEIEAAEYIRKSYSEMRDYLVGNQMLDKYRENYVTHVRKGFLETAKDEGVFPAMKEIFKQQKQDEAVFNIMSGNTGEILPLEKFFQFSLKRTGELKPTENVAKAFLTYVKTFEKKRAFDEIIPKISVYADAVAPKKQTPRGLEFDRSLKTFVNEWINNKKGRRTDFQGKLKQGGELDTVLRAGKAFTSMLDLGFSIPAGAASNIGEQATNYVQMGTKNYALGLMRMNTKQGEAIVNNYRNFVGVNPWTHLSNAADDAGSTLQKGMFALFRDAQVRANKGYLLGMLSPEEFKTGVVSPEHLATLNREMGRWRVVDGAHSVVGSTSAGGVVTQYKTWAVPIIRTTMKNLTSIAKNPKLAKSREGQELLRSAIVGGTAALIGYALIDGDKKNSERSFVEKVASKAARDLLSTVGALDPKFWFAEPRIMSFVNDFVTGISQIITAEAYKQSGKDYLEGDLKGVKTLERTFTPQLFKQFDNPDGLTALEREKIKILPESERNQAKDYFVKKRETEKAKSDRNEKLDDDMVSVYEEIQNISGTDMEEAKRRVEALTDEEYASYKRIKTRKKTQKNDLSDANMSSTVENVMRLKESGDMQEAQKIVNSMSDDEYKAYERVKKNLGY